MCSHDPTFGINKNRILSPIFRGVFLSFSYAGGGGEGVAPIENQPPLLNSLTKFGMCIGLCTKFKFQF